MSSIEEQLALFEQEVLLVINNEPKNNINGSAKNESQNVKDEKTIFGPAPTAIVNPKPVSNSNNQPSNAFIPNQLQMNHPIANLLRNGSASFSIITNQMPSTPSVIESGPTIYITSNGNNAASSSSNGGSSSKKKKNDDIKDKASTSQINSMKTMALPADVELLAARRQAVRAHENTYLGQVMRGEKKMKRFVRTGGGQVWEDPSLAEWDPNDFRIFCGDLGNEVSDELLAKAFRKYPSFQKAKVVRDNRTNKSKGYGFVSFKHQDDFIRAVREMDGKYVGNRPIKLRKSNWKERNLEMVRKKDKEKKKLGLSS